MRKRCTRDPDTSQLRSPGSGLRPINLVPGLVGAALCLHSPRLCVSYSAPLQADWLSLVLLLPGDGTSVFPPEEPGSLALGASLLGRCFGTYLYHCTSWSQLPMVTGRDYPDLKPGEEGLDLAEVTQPRRSGQDSGPGRLSPERPLLLSRARVSTLCPGGPDPQLVAGPSSGCSELSVTEAAGLEAPPWLLSPRAAHISLPSACPWRVAPAPSAKISPF